MSAYEKALSLIPLLTEIREDSNAGTACFTITPRRILGERGGTNEHLSTIREGVYENVAKSMRDDINREIIEYCDERIRVLRYEAITEASEFIAQHNELEIHNAKSCNSQHHWTRRTRPRKRHHKHRHTTDAVQRRGERSRRRR